MFDSLKWFFRRKDAYARTFASPDGKLVLGDLIRFCCMNQEIHVPGDPYDTAHLAGKRRVGLHITSILNVGPEEIERRVQQHERDKQSV